MAGAVVTLSPCYVAGHMWYERATTAPDGSYTVSASPFCYFAVASSPGFVPQDYGRDTSPWAIALKLSSGDKVENIDFHLEVAAVISGSVSDGSQPVANIRVSAVRVQFWLGGESHLRKVQSVMTDGRGNFRLDALPEGGYFVCADAAHSTAGATGPAPGWTYHLSFYPSAPSVEKAQGIHATTGKEVAGIRLRVTADKTYTIVAQAQDPNAGKNAPRLYMGFARGTSSGGSRDNVVTIQQVFPGTYTLVILAKDVSGQQTVGVGSQTVQVVDSDVHITVPIGRLGEVRGRAAVQPAGAVSPSDVRMLLRSDEGWARSSIDANGNFYFQDVVPGPQVFMPLDKSKKVYLKQARCLGRDYTTELLTIQAGEVVIGCDLTLAADTGVISGTVSKGGKPAVGMAVVLIPRSVALRKIRSYTLTATTDATGYFQMEGVIPGDYFLFAVPLDIDAPYYALDFADRNQSNAQSVSVKPNETQVVNLKPTRP